MKYQEVHKALEVERKQRLEEKEDREQERTKDVAVMKKMSIQMKCWRKKSMNWRIGVRG